MSGTKSRLSLVASVATALLTTALLAPQASATDLSPYRAYAEGEVKDQPMTGVYMSITGDQEDLSLAAGFINKEEWLLLASNGGEWIEAGTTKGPINGSNGYYQKSWSGHFMGYQSYHASTGRYEYYDHDFQAQFPTGTHNFQISRDNNPAEWVVYMDFARVASVPLLNAYTQGWAHDVGIESMDDQNTFSNGTYASAMQFRDASGAWVKWSDPGVVEKDISDSPPSLSWYTYYDKTANRLDLLR